MDKKLKRVIYKTNNGIALDYEDTYFIVCLQDALAEKLMREKVIADYERNSLTSMESMI